MKFGAYQIVQVDSYNIAVQRKKKNKTTNRMEWLSECWFSANSIDSWIAALEYVGLKRINASRATGEVVTALKSLERVIALLADDFFATASKPKLKKRRE